ncbi:hypothetical protein D3C71_1588290 [compost metagenome]
MAMADQVDLLGTRRGQDLLDLLERLLASRLGAVDRRHLQDVHVGAIGLQRQRNAVEVAVEAGEAVPAAPAVDQDNRILGRGVAGMCRAGHREQAPEYAQRECALTQQLANHGPSPRLVVVSENP